MKEQRKKPQNKSILPVKSESNAPIKDLNKPLADKSNYKDRKNPHGGCGC